MRISSRLHMPGRARRRILRCTGSSRSGRLTRADSFRATPSGTPTDLFALAASSSTKLSTTNVPRATPTPRQNAVFTAGGSATHSTWMSLNAYGRFAELSTASESMPSLIHDGE